LQAFYLPQMRIFVTQNRMSSALFGYSIRGDGTALRRRQITAVIFAVYPRGN